MRRLMPILILAALALPPGQAQAARRHKTLTVAEQFELGQRYMKRGYYIKALEQFSRIRNYHRDDPYAVKAELAIADVHFKKSEWDQARLAYEDFMRMHPRNEDLDYVVYRVGLCLYKKSPKAPERDQTWTRQAVNTWAGFESRFPESELSPDATSKLTECRERLARKELLIARFYQRRDAWRAVAGRTQGMLDDYPDSAYVPDGLTLLAQAQAWLGHTDQADRAIAQLASMDPERARRAAALVAKAQPPK